MGSATVDKSAVSSFFILTMTRSDYKGLSADHPGSTGRVLANLLEKVQELPIKSVPRESSHFDRESEADIAQERCM